MLRQSILILVALVALNVNASTNTETDPYSDYITLEIEKLELEELLFAQETKSEIINPTSINIIEIEEEVDLGFNPKNYLPESFNVLAGMDVIDWDAFELVEIEEEVDLGFDTKHYLPKGFNPYKGMTCESTKVAYSH